MTNAEVSSHLLNKPHDGFLAHLPVRMSRTLNKEGVTIMQPYQDLLMDIGEGLLGQVVYS